MDYRTYEGYSDPSKDRTPLLSMHGNYLSASLFAERDLWPESMKSKRKDGEFLPPAVYTLGEQEKDGLLSAYQIYINSVDEFEAAQKLVGSLHHWEALCKKKWFMKELVIWRRHMALRDYSTSKKCILEDVYNGDGSAARKIMDLCVKVLDDAKDLSPTPKKAPKGKTQVRPSTSASPSAKAENQDFDKLLREHVGSYKQQ